MVYTAVFLKQRMDTILMCSATKPLCSFSHVKLCTEIQLWCHFLYYLQCRWLSWAESHSRYNTCSTITCGDKACWSCVPGSTKEVTSHLPWKPFHSQEAHVKILFCGDFQSHSATVFQHAVIFLLWIFISWSSVYKFAFCYVGILHGWTQHTVSSWLLTVAFLISVLPATFINLDSLFTAIWWMKILNRAKPSVSFPY